MFQRYGRKNMTGKKLLLAVLFAAHTVGLAADPHSLRSVKDYGAVGDGKADDTAAIEAAVKAGVGVVSQVYCEIWRVHE